MKMDQSPYQTEGISQRMQNKCMYTLISQSLRHFVMQEMLCCANDTVVNEDNDPPNGKVEK